jgi:hypothetical protein
MRGGRDPGPWTRACFAEHRGPADRPCPKCAASLRPCPGGPRSQRGPSETVRMNNTTVEMCPGFQLASSGSARTGNGISSQLVRCARTRSPTDDSVSVSVRNLSSIWILMSLESHSGDGHRPSRTVYSAPKFARAGTPREGTSRGPRAHWGGSYRRATKPSYAFKECSCGCSRARAPHVRVDADIGPSELAASAGNREMVGPCSRSCAALSPATREGSSKPEHSITPQVGCRRGPKDAANAAHMRAGRDRSGYGSGAPTTS